VCASATLSGVALLEACRLAHDDDAPRLVWADDVGGERGELVVLQCDLARDGIAGAERAARVQRQRELLAAHGTTWAGYLARFATRWQFRRGFVEAAEIDARAFMRKADAIFAAAPLLVSLTATGIGDELGIVHELVQQPAFWRLTGLELVDPQIGDDAVDLLLANNALESLRALGLAGLTPAAAHRLVASRELATLEKLKLADHALGDDAVIAILRAAPRLTSLDLTDVRGDVAAIARVLPPLRELRIGPVTDAGVDALAAGPAGATLRTLILVDSETDVGAAHRFPALRSLDANQAPLL